MEACVPLMDVKENQERWEEIGEVIIKDLGYSKDNLKSAAM